MHNTSENIQVGDVSGMGPISLPDGDTTGSGDVPKGKKKKSKKLKKLLGFDEFTNK